MFAKSYASIIKQEGGTITVPNGERERGTSRCAECYAKIDVGSDYCHRCRPAWLGFADKDPKTFGERLDEGFAMLNQSEQY